MIIDKVRMRVCLLLVIIGVVSSQNDRIQRVGNKLAARITGVETPGVTFLLRDQTPEPGVVFAFSAFFRTQSKVRLQVWRPPGNDSSGVRGQNFTLLADFQVAPTQKEQVEDIYIMSLLTERCVQVTSRDRFGIFFEEAPGAVAYAFDATNPEALASTLDNQTIPNKVGDTALFDTLTFPYDFSLAAYVDTNLTDIQPDDDRPDCPKGLLIPKDTPITLPPTTTTVPPTGAPGARGPPGPAGPIGPKGNPGTNGTNGLAGIPGRNGTNGAPGAPGERGMPGAAGATGQSIKGDKGDAGSTGPAGPAGLVGPAGPDGKTGPAGPPGPPGSGKDPSGKDPNGKDPNEVDPKPIPVSNETNTFSNPWLVLAALIWLAILTLIVVIVIVIVSHVHRKRDQERKHPDGLSGNIYVEPTPLGSTNDVSNNRERILSTKSDVSEPGWIKGMKEESESQFSHDTIERADSRPQNDPNTGYIDMSGATEGEGNIRTSELRNY